MSRKARVFVGNAWAGTIEETDDGDYRFCYEPEYLALDPKPLPVSLTLPLRAKPYESKVLFPFFDGLIPGGWLLNLMTKNWKLAINDRMGLLLASCEDCIGNVSIREERTNA